MVGKRAIFAPPSERDFLLLFSSDNLRIKGGSLGDISTFKSDLHYQRGSGFWSFLKKNVLPFLIKKTTPHAIEFVKGIASDAITGNANLRSSLKSRGVRALKGVGKEIISGGGIRKTKKTKKNRKNKQVRKYVGKKNKNKVGKDIFAFI